MNKLFNNRALLILHIFVGMTAIAGGLSLIANPEMLPLEWIQGTFFDNYFLPGVILFGVVGSSAVIAALSLLLKLNGRYMASLISSVFLCFWLIAEIVIIGQIHLLQFIYLTLAISSLYSLYSVVKQDTK